MWCIKILKTCTSVNFSNFSTNCALETSRMAALVGTIFSGPTTGDGAAIYYNPAAMTLVNGTTDTYAVGTRSSVMGTSSQAEVRSSLIGLRV